MEKNRINTNVANMHLSPDARSEVCSQAIYGEEVKSLEKKDKWVLIETPDEYCGWIQSKQLSNELPKLNHHATVSSLFAHLYSSPDTSSFPILTLAYGSSLNIISANIQERWLEVLLLDGQKAWIQRGDLNLKPSHLKLEEMLTLSQRFVGLPYTWGGTTTFGFDCSGFVQMLFRQMGIILPRDSYLQAEAKKTVAIGINQLLPGDLVFFANPGQKISHVALYLSVDTIIHTKANLFEGAPAVQCHRLSRPLWDEEIVSARRVLL